MMSTEQASWRRDANELRILARIKAAQIFNRLSGDVSNLFNKLISLGVFSRRRYHFGKKTFHIINKSIRKVDCYKRR